MNKYNSNWIFCFWLFSTISNKMFCFWSSSRKFQHISNQIYCFWLSSRKPQHISNKIYCFLLSFSKPWKLWNVDESLAGLVRHRVWRDDWSERPRRSTLGDGGKFEGNPVAAQTKIVESFISDLSGKLKWLRKVRKDKHMIRKAGDKVAYLRTELDYDILCQSISKCSKLEACQCDYCFI